MTGKHQLLSLHVGQSQTHTKYVSLHQHAGRETFTRCSFEAGRLPHKNADITLRINTAVGNLSDIIFRPEQFSMASLLEEIYNRNYPFFFMLSYAQIQLFKYNFNRIFSILKLKKVWKHFFPKYKEANFNQ